MAAEEAGFELFITADQEISYQQNLTGRKMALLVLSTNNWDFIKAAIGKITPLVTHLEWTIFLKGDVWPYTRNKGAM